MILTLSDLDNLEIKIQLEHILDNKDIKERFRAKVGDYSAFTEEQLKNIYFKIIN